jgi:hypothetical protein
VTPDDEFPPGINCPKCGGTVWKATTTRKAKSRIRRWKVCIGCGHGPVRTVEIIEMAGQVNPGFKADHAAEGQNSARQMEERNPGQG